MSNPTPRPGSTWQHKEGNIYTVCPCPDIGMVKIPGAGWLKGPWVRYFDDHDFYIRTLADFHANFTPLED
jgi:hypothetical protein